MRTTPLLLVSFVAVASFAAGQTERRVSMFAGGGIAVPSAPDTFRDGWKEGFEVVFGVGFPLASKLTLQGTVAHDRFSIDKDLFLFDWAGGEAEVLSFSGELRFRFVDSERLSPYLVGGGGVARVSTKDLTLPLPPPDLFTDSGYFDPRFYGPEVDGFAETTAMTTFGGGVDVPFTGSTQFFAEARYRIAFTSGEDMDLLSGGLAFLESTAHWTIAGGLRFFL